MATVNYMRQRTQSRSAMRTVLAYVIQESKTTCDLVRGLDCSPENTYRDFMTTKNAYDKADGAFFYHYTQSFSPEENITPPQANEIGMEFAKAQFPGFEVLIATHIDREHIHNHLVVNSVSHENGKKLRQHPTSLLEHRAVSDRICMEHGLSVLEPYNGQQRKRGLGTREYRAAEKGQSWKFALMGTIDRCMDRSHTQAEFVSHMQSFGYGVDFNDGPQKRKTITYTTPKGYKCRDNRLHENKYLKENMLYEFQLRQSQSRQYAIGAARFADTDIAFDEAVSAPDLRNPAGAMGRDREDFAVDRKTVQDDPYRSGDIADQEIVPEFYERVVQDASGASTGAISTDGSDIGQDIIPGGEYRQAVGSDISTGWEASRQHLFELPGADGFSEQEIEVADRESVPVYDTGRIIAADVLHLAKNVFKIGSYEDDLDNIIGLAALAGLSVVGVCKLIEMLQNHDEADITVQTVEEIIEELSQQHENLEGEPIWNTENQVQEQTQEHEQEQQLTM